MVTLTREIENSPNNANLYHKRAIYYCSRLNYLKALEDAKKAISIDSANASYFVSLSDIYFATDKVRDSKIALEKAISIDPKNSLALIKLGEFYFLIQKYQEAFDFIDKALKVDEHIAKAYFLKGMIFKELKDTSKAISSFITAVEQDQSY